MVDKLTRLGWGDAADYFGRRDMKYWKAEMKVLAIVKLQTVKVTATPGLKTSGDFVQTDDIVPGQWQMPQGTTQPGSSQMRLVPKKPHSGKCLMVVLHTEW